MCYDWLRRSVVGTVFLDKSYDGLGRDYIYYAPALSLSILPARLPAASGSSFSSMTRVFHLLSLHAGQKSRWAVDRSEAPQPMDSTGDTNLFVRSVRHQNEAYRNIHWTGGFRRVGVGRRGCGRKSSYFSGTDGDQGVQ